MSRLGGGNLPGSFQIFIALPSDDVCTLKGLTRDMFIYQLKSRVELKAGIPADIFNLFFMNTQLSDQETLKSYHLKHGCIVRVKIESNWIGLFEACWRGDIYDVFENGVQFLDVDKFHGYNIVLWNKLVIHRATYALFIACHRGYLGLILELINRGATDINGKTVFGRTALHVAAYQGFVGCVSLLLSEGAVCNQIDINGKTPLALASENGHVYCERRLWLYQLSLQTFRSPSRSTSSSVSTESEGRGSKSVSSKPSTGRTTEQPDHNNNEEQAVEALHFHLPRVTISTDKQHVRRTKSHEPLRRSALPLMQIAEKYRKELQEYNEGTGNLPRVQNEPKEGKERPDNAPEPAHQGRTEGDEVEIVKEANDTDKLVTSVLQDHNREEPKEDLPQEKNAEAMNKVPTRDETGYQEPDNRERSSETGHQDRENSRPSSGKTDGIRKLDILMTKSSEKFESGRTFEAEEASNTELRRDEKESDEREAEEVFFDFQEYSRRKPAQTFQHWLEMKRAQARNRPCTAPAQKSKLGKSIDPESFKKWLNAKRLNRTHTTSESSVSPRKTFISSGGLTFDHWLETKTSKRPLSAMNHVTEFRDNASGAGNKVQKQLMAGKSFDLWLAEKRKMSQSFRRGECNDDENKNASKSGKSFEVWLQDKRNQQQIELIQKMTTEKEEQRRKNLEQLRKWFNPHYKTYDDWLAIKNHEAVVERFKAQNEPATQEREIPSEEKEKDARVVFDIWHTMKALEELSDEEKKYHEMKAKWAAKEREREQLKRLNNINKVKKNNSAALKLAQSKQ